MDLYTQIESVPATYPVPPPGLSSAASDLDHQAIWERIEGYVSYRWSERQVVWIFRGPGWFIPPLKPAVVDTAEVWTPNGWETATLIEAPVGYAAEEETYRITATVGSTEDPPSAVLEAYRRYAEYLADQAVEMGRVATSANRSIGDLSQSGERPATWHARALQYSGAADLLRRFRSRN